jgi:hypothetical protein
MYFILEALVDLMVRVIHVRKFIPLTVNVGQLTRGVELEVALNRLDDALSKALNELGIATGDRKIMQIGINVSNVNLGNVGGLLIIAYALVDEHDETREGSG